MQRIKSDTVVVFVFGDGHQTLAAEDALLSVSIAVEIVILPTELGLGCGTALKVPSTAQPEAEKAMMAEGIKAVSLWQAEGSSWEGWKKIRC